MPQRTVNEDIVREREVGYAMANKVAESSIAPEIVPTRARG